MYGRRPLTKLESGLYAAIVGILIVVFARQMLGLMEVAERSAMQATLINVTAAVNVRLAQGMLDPRAGPVDWNRTNPFELAGASPPNFSPDADSGSVEAGHWAYDAANSELVYLPRLRATLEVAEGQQLLRFRLVRGRVGFQLQPTVSFTWQ